MQGLHVDHIGTRIDLGADGGELDVRDYDPLVLNGLEGELADGATFVLSDGCSVTRRGSKAIWWTPPGLKR